MIILKGTSLDEIGCSLANWFIRESGNNILPPFSAMGFMTKDGDIKGVAVFNDFNSSNVEIHLHAPKCICKQTYKAVLKYVFNELKCNRLTAKPYRSNKRLLRLLPRLGFEYECILHQYYGAKPQEDAIVHKITPKNASFWIEVENNA